MFVLHCNIKVVKAVNRLASSSAYELKILYMIYAFLISKDCRQIYRSLHSKYRSFI